MNFINDLDKKTIEQLKQDENYLELLIKNAYRKDHFFDAEQYEGQLALIKKQIETLKNT